MVLTMSVLNRSFIDDLSAPSATGLCDSDSLRLASHGGQGLGKEFSPMQRPLHSVLGICMEGSLDPQR